ncbi:MAG TPA: glycosyltransferase, partial [Gammaproteobacteria bacterium]|nr:glycosyltransferase [Gammaproteobacteria bacterium]
YRGGAGERGHPARRHGPPMTILTAIALGLWAAVLVVPWQPWRCRERLEAEAEGAAASETDFTVLIPARNEASVIGETLAALAAAAPGAPVIVTDDESDDGTAGIVGASGLQNLILVAGTPPPPGWAGKLWALEQGLARVHTQRVLLVDADIRLAPGMIAAVQRKADEGYALVSVLAEPCWRGLATRLLLPAFVYFFKLLYPFALANRPRGPIAAAAGGVILVEREVLASIGGFAAWHDAIIDDCALAARVKRAGQRTFLGLSRGAQSLRQQNLASIAAMVTRSAWVQLHESPLLLLAATALLVLAFWVPPAALAFAGVPRWLGVAACAALAASYLPVLLYYRRNPLAAILLPVVATAYLVLTWLSALRAATGTRSAWKGRRYRRKVRDEP